MSFWDKLGSAVGILQKPAGAYAGLIGGLAKALGGNAFDPENRLGYDDPLEGLIKGWKSQEGMYSTMNKLYGDYDNIGRVEGLLAGISDMGYDPLNVAMPAAGAALKGVPLVGKAVEGAGTIGKLGEGASAAGKAGQLGRRYLTSLQLTGEPLSAIGVASMQGLAERGIGGLAKSKALTNLMAKGGNAVDEGVAAVEAAAPAARKIMPGARPTPAAKGFEKTIGAPTTPLQNMEAATGVKNPTTLDLARSVLPEAASNRANKDAVNKLLKLRDSGQVTPEMIETADAGVIARRAPKAKMSTPKPNPNVEAGLGAPAAKDLDISRMLTEAQVPPFLRRGNVPTPPTPPMPAAPAGPLEMPQSNFDAWRRAALGEFAPTAQSEAVTPEQLAYFLQNYG